MKTIDVVITDDHAVVRTGYRRLLELDEGMRVVAEFGDADTAYDWLVRNRADVLILDLSMPGRGGLEMLQRLRIRVPALHTLVFSMHDSAAIVMQAMRAGAVGYLTKNSAPEALVDAVRRVAGGLRVLSDDIAGLLDTGGQPPHLALSPREFDLFRQFARGTALEDVAARFCLSTKTVANYQTLIRKKMGLANRIEMHRYAVEHGFG
ncbi:MULTISPECIES: response regulator transcription factor [Cupriavidus]|uniref:Two component transcriptional regulator, LuxR family n=1 Tax=Cupriavidus pinatubonensis (strain JMP 134 / LMG 1197) TaxID=264198 RepID=Q470N3_CUPPJ|nr:MULTISPECIES: response regulator transcription factor [Cupriavidus]TPQ41051.1 DNA-binding response regulator [Cupriavidus pinatubonensis]